MQDSTEFALREMEDAAKEETRIAFAYVLLRTFEESGLTPKRASELGIDKAAFWHATNIEKAKFEMPGRDTLWRWCRILYAARGRRPGDDRLFTRIVHLAGYQTPAEIDAVRSETTKHYAIQRPRTDALGNSNQKAYRAAVRQAVQNAQQFRKPHPDL